MVLQAHGQLRQFLVIMVVLRCVVLVLTALCLSCTATVTAVPPWPSPQHDAQATGLQTLWAKHGPRNFSFTLDSAQDFITPGAVALGLQDIAYVFGYLNAYGPLLFALNTSSPGDNNVLWQSPLGRWFQAFDSGTSPVVSETLVFAALTDG